MKKILVVEDERALSEVIEITLKGEGFNVECAFDGENGIDKFFESKPDLILLDINLPNKNGWEVCQEIRKHSSVPIIFMTARDSELDELHGLEIGADDYVTKPFSLKILVARIKKALKLEGTSIYGFKRFQFNFKGLELSIEGVRVDLSKREAQLLEYLIKNKDVTLPREKILREIWGFDPELDERAVDTLVKRLRKKLGDYEGIIKTIRGIGYTFNEI